MTLVTLEKVEIFLLSHQWKLGNCFWYKSNNWIDIYYEVGGKWVTSICLTIPYSNYNLYLENCNSSSFKSFTENYYKLFKPSLSFEDFYNQEE